MSTGHTNQGAPSDTPKRSNVVKVLHWGDNPAKIICLLGSTRFQGEFLSAAKAFTLQGSIVLLPGFFTNRDGVGLDKEEQELIQELTFKKIEMADTIFVVNPNNRITESVREQIEYAKSLDRIVKYLETPQS